MTARRTRFASVLRAALLAAVSWVAACGDVGDPPAIARQGRFGSLRDLVLFPRSGSAGGPFFLDRFEATRADYAEFAASSDGMAAGAKSPRVREDLGELPASGMDLRTARAFASWRFCRLMRAEEWLYACTSDGRDAFPWGSRRDPSRTNTSELGVFAALPVGTFESGRLPSGVYDLVGNVAEWTETVPLQFFAADRESFHVVANARTLAQEAPALGCWSPLRVVAPAAFVVAAAGDLVPRETVGSDFASSMDETRELRAPSDFSDRIGMRLAVTPLELVEKLGDAVLALAPAEEVLWGRFCGKPDHSAALRPAVAAAAISAPARARWREVLR